MSSSKGKLLITGATGGLGRELVLALAPRYEIFFTYHSNLKKAHELQQLVKNKFNKTINFSPLNLSDMESIQHLYNQLDDDFSVLINNGAIGTGTVQAQAQQKHTQDQALIMVNALGPLWMSELFLKKMSSKSARTIINISSVGGGIFHYPGFRLADGMSKAAMTFMAKQMAAEHCHDGVSIITFCPGAMDTPMLQASTLDHMNADQRKKFVQSLPHEKMVSTVTLAQHIASILITGPEIFHGAVIDCSQGLGVNPALIGK